MRHVPGLPTPLALVRRGIGLADWNQAKDQVMTDRDVTPENATLADQREATAWRILRAAYLRVLCAQTGQRPIELSHAEQNALLERWFPAMDRDLAMLRECFAHAAREGAETVHRAAAGESADMLEPSAPTAEAPLMETPRHVVIGRDRPGGVK